MNTPAPDSVSELSIEKAALEHLGWNEIKKAIADRAHSAAAADILLNFPLLDDPVKISAELDAVEEARALLRSHSSPNLSIPPLDAIFLRLEKGGALIPIELLEIKQLAETSSELIRFFERKGEDAPHLAAIAEDLADLSRLAEQIADVIHIDGEIKDTASDLLYELRKKHAELSRVIKSRLDNILASSTLLPHLQDRYHTVRNDRFVIPVKSGSQRHISGIVHDYSGSGQTVFIEPVQIVEAGNDLVMATNEIREEEKRLLAELTALAAKNIERLKSNLALTAKLDTYFARALLAEDLGLNKPTIGDGVYLAKLQNPLMLLNGERCIKNDVELPASKRAMIITGPNAGGKSVLLKSIGVAVLMLRAGIPIAASPDSRIYPFSPVFAAFGDAQDISLKLSTFSGHIKIISGILESAVGRSLVLLDEIGTDTDPNEGAALAIGVLEELNEQGATVFATTHYPELRALALNDDRFVNAAVGYDPESYEPTYRLHSGFAGQSFAIAVAERLGLKPHIVERAKELLGEREWRLSELARELMEQKERLDKEIETMEREKEALKKKLDAADERAKKLDEREFELQTKKRNALIEEIETTRKRVAEIIKDLQGVGGLKTAVDKSRELTLLSREERKKIIETEEKRYFRDLYEGRALKKEELSVGMTVYVPAFRISGKLVSFDLEKQRGVIDAGGMRVDVYLYELRRLEERVGEDKRVDVKRTRLKPEDIAPQATSGETMEIELDLRGERMEEGLSRLEEFLDKAFRNKAPFVRVIHGHGTGVLKKAVRQALGTHRFVKNFRPAPQNQGGDGATEITLDTSPEKGSG
ncbi:MAG: endonuclease MutS2 [Myxococcota bacterium]